MIIIIEELQLINHWLITKDIGFLRKLGIDRSYFFVLNDVVGWIDDFVVKTGQLPSQETVATEFEDFKKMTSLEPVEYLSSVLRENKAYTEYRPILTTNAQLVNDGKTIEAMWKMRSDIDNLLRTYSTKMTRYDWVKNAIERYEKYMEKHGMEGLQGLPSGIPALDALTGGWKDDDLILLSGRTNEGKSLVGGFFAYHVWQYVQKAKVNAPIIYITTEMPELEISYRLDTLRAHFSNRALNEGRLVDPDAYREYLEELEKKDSSFLILSQEANGGRPFTPTDIRAIIESEKPAFICIDQLYDISDGTGERDIRRRIVNVSNAIREINLYTKTPTMLIAQAGRDAARAAKKDPNATPELFDIQESDNPAQKATRVITLRLVNDIFKLSLKKNRGGVKDKDVFMRANIDTGIWEEVSAESLAF